jgi:hypothetical protein
VVGAGQLGGERPLPEGDDADVHCVWLLAHERGRGGLGGGQAGGRDVFGAHAVGDVEGQDHRARGSRHRHRRLWTGGAEEEQGQRGEHQQRRQVPPHAPAPRPGGLESGGRQRRRASPLQQLVRDEQPHPDRRRDGQEEGVLEGHARLRFDR